MKLTIKERLLFATSNKHKIQEVTDIVAPRGIQVLPLESPAEPPEETGQSFVENALLKARYYSQLTGEICLAEDSGLVVPSLNGDPGIFSSRYAGPDATDDKNRQKLLAELADSSLRNAYFVSCLVCYFPTSPYLPIVAQGIWQGSIAKAERGKHGFGYDPVFIPVQSLQKGTDTTSAEMSAQEKNSLSHRANALEVFVQEWNKFF